MTVNMSAEPVDKLGTALVEARTFDGLRAALRQVRAQLDGSSPARIVVQAWLASRGMIAAVALVLAVVQQPHASPTW